jgi:hypothetical protein
MKLLASLVALALTSQQALGADLVYKAPPEALAPTDNPCGAQGFVKVRLVEGAFHARSVTGQTASVTEPDTVTIVCADGRIVYTQVSQSILPFNPEIAVIPVPELALLAGAAVVVALVIGRRDEDRPVSP